MADELTDTEIAAATAAGLAELDVLPRAASARYDAGSGRVMVELANGCLFAFPARLVQDLAGASDADLAVIDIGPHGLGLSWPAIDADIWLPALVNGVFGTRRWMAGEMGRKGGAVRSPAKTAAARSNGSKGGRPRKSAA
ncbi:DUF2442 domain-containing protein [Sandarakinorhabdus sp.]|jgi:hypothetical protein|uniref:DUF2442 domain-containing protein n=1 Tax=Sandarakinorhabdus sp. TaxID=1916663 RepID=UPI003342CBD7